VAYLRDEHARGAFDLVELGRRTEAVTSARTVAELLAATAPEPATGHPTPRPVRTRTNTLALVAGIAFAILVALVVLGRLG
jgi:hypothetical protein